MHRANKDSRLVKKITQAEIAHKYWKEPKVSTHVRNGLNSIRIISIGYEKRSVYELLEILTLNKVNKLLDIRLVPVSRRKEFNKKALASHLDKAGIEYVHLHSAGNPYYKQKNDIDLCLRRYSDYLNKYPEIIEHVTDELLDSTTAILCYERKHEYCHRSVLLNTISKNGHKLEIIRVD
jgi:uncharacterized protein (DUF488 family)